MRNKFDLLPTLLLAAVLAILVGCDSNDRTSDAGDYIDDTVITTKVKTAIFGDDHLSGYDISVETNDGVVRLSGTVSSQNKHDRAAQIAGNVDGVKSINNSIQVGQGGAR